ncbi:MAG: EAL domain-containing protein [Gammaproteobacteria bacterium]|nr:EAL domain-containing protein [Gammaproteobacteria bacterium]MCI0591800.1 EAL domain-containing protein [Gammaproteobacteria bacterium]
MCSTKTILSERVILDNVLRSADKALIAATDLRFRVQYLNKAAKKTFGRATEHIENQLCSREKQILKRIQDEKSEFHVTLTSQNSRRRSVVDAEISGIWNDDKVLLGFLLVGNDVTETTEAEIELRASERKYRALYDENPCMCFTVDPGGTVLTVNRHGAEQLGYRVNELVGKSIFKIIHEQDREATKQVLEKAMQEPDRLHHREIRAVHKDRVGLWVREAIRASKDDAGAIVILIAGEDVTEARQLSEELSYQASHDVLTGLVNRREFERRLKRVLHSSRADQTEHALLYLDLDRFKTINDTCGHLAGDELLRQLGEVLRGTVRSRDTLARLGGDEFGVLLEHCSVVQARRLAKALQKIIQNFRFGWEGRNLSIGVSIGLVPINKTSESMTNILSMTDAALFAAKEAGRNCIHVYQEADSELARKRGELQWVPRIQQALEEDRFHLVFQPIRPIAKGNVEGEHYELQIRMEDEDGRIVPPGAFLPAAERYNLSTTLDRWVIRTAFRWLSNHPEHLERLYLCSINLSSHVFGEEDFVEFIIRQLNKQKIPAEKIGFEVPETAAIANLSSATRFIKALKELGCWFALDDFGSGLSSFGYLRNLPVDFLKIDGAFVRNIVEDPVDFAMVSSINEIGHVLGKKTIAEFVENDAILEKLRTIGVDYAQGYGMGRPQVIDRLG